MRRVLRVFLIDPVTDDRLPRRELFLLARTRTFILIRAILLRPVHQRQAIVVIMIPDQARSLGWWRIIIILHRIPTCVWLRGRYTRRWRTTISQLLTPSRYCVVQRIVALSSDHFREDAAPRVYEPIAHLQYGQVRLLGQGQLFCIAGVRIVSVLV